MDTPTFNELSICAGYGGLGMGVGIAVPGTRGVCYVEREAASIEILAARMQDGSMAEAPIWTDLCTFDGKPWRGVVDIITAGIPCQPWSLAGKQAGFEDERHLGEELIRVVGEVGPSYVFVENVAGFVRLGAPDLLGRLSEIGYDAEWGLFSAAGVGATHRRQRFFLLAYRRGMANTGCLNAGRLQHGRRDTGARNPTPDLGKDGKNVAYRDSGGLSGKRTGNDHHRGNERGRITYRCDAELADPKRPRPQEEPEPREPGPHDGATRRGGRAAVGNTGGPRADLQSSGEYGDTASIFSKPGFRPPFPPGPTGDWSGIPEEYQPAVALPAGKRLEKQVLQPRHSTKQRQGDARVCADLEKQEASKSPLRGVVDGTPGRVDQLRMLGNGVVPLQAAHAFTALYRRISS